MTEDTLLKNIKSLLKGSYKVIDSKLLRDIERQALDATLEDFFKNPKEPTHCPTIGLLREKEVTYVSNNKRSKELIAVLFGEFPKAEDVNINEMLFYIHFNKYNINVKLITALSKDIN